jgi:hypothetical protein
MPLRPSTSSIPATKALPSSSTCRKSRHFQKINTHETSENAASTIRMIFVMGVAPRIRSHGSEARPASWSTRSAAGVPVILRFLTGS